MNKDDQDALLEIIGEHGPEALRRLAEAVSAPDSLNTTCNGAGATVTLVDEDTNQSYWVRIVCGVGEIGDLEEKLN